MLTVSNIYLNNSLNTFGLSILILNVINYIIVFMLIMSIVLLCDLSKFKSLNQFKEFNSYSFITYTTILSLMSMAGIPPLLGFTGKFLAIIYSTYKSQVLIVFIMLILNIFSMYFYIQNLRFTVKKTKSSVFKFKTYYVNLNYSIILNIVILNFLNIFGIFFLNDLIIVTNYIASYIYI